MEKTLQNLKTRIKSFERLPFMDTSLINTKLCDDTLGKIFLFSLPHPDDTPPSNGYISFALATDSGAPFSFLFVCRRWRYLALDTSRLWRSVRTPSLRSNVRAFTNQAMSNQLQFLIQWLAFSQELPLSVQCISPAYNLLSQDHDHYYIPFLYQQSPPIRHVLNALGAVMLEEGRWTAFDAVFDHNMLNSFVSAPQFTNPSTSNVMAVNLTYLKMHFDGLFTFMDIKNTKKLYSWITKLPYLQTLILQDDPVMGSTWVFQDMNVSPFNKIPNIEFSRLHMTAKDGAELLSACAGARSVRLLGHNLFNYPQQHEDMMSFSPPQTFENLTRLSLYGVQFPIALIARSTFPVLDYLKIVSCMEPSSISVSNDFSQFLRHSSASLKTVILHSRKMNARDAFSILCIPSLRNILCVDLQFQMSRSGRVKALMTEEQYQWFRDGPNFIVWKYEVHDMSYNFGWKALEGEEVLVWEHKDGISYPHMNN